MKEEGLNGGIEKYRVRNGAKLLLSFVRAKNVRLT